MKCFFYFQHLFSVYLCLSLTLSLFHCFSWMSSCPCRRGLGQSELCIGTAVVPPLHTFSLKPLARAGTATVTKRLFLNAYSHNRALLKGTAYFRKLNLQNVDLIMTFCYKGINYYRSFFNLVL